MSAPPVIEAVQAFTQQLHALLAADTPEVASVTTLAELLDDTPLVLLHVDNDNAQLQWAASTLAVDAPPALYLSTYNAADDSLIARLQAGEVVTLTADAPANWEPLRQAFDADALTLQPLHIDETFIGVVGAVTSDVHQQATLAALAPGLAAVLHHAQRQQRTAQKLKATQQEIEIFRQIDTELTQITELQYIFTMIVDWALRFTNADAAGLTVYDPQNQRLRLVASYGYQTQYAQLNRDIPPAEAGISYRVAQTAKPEIVPNIAEDKDYFPRAEQMRSQLTVPITREDEVIAVLALESKQLNGFNDDHFAFVQKLTRRAGIAVDNARLFTETQREQEKLAYILRHIADVVIVLGTEGRIKILNEAAVLALHLSVDDDYTGRSFSDVVNHSQLKQLYHDAIQSGERAQDEVELPNGRIYSATLEHHDNIGQIVILRDVTHYKEADQIKTEFVAAVSHDLKQPLSSMKGYLDLLQMVNDFDERSTRYTKALKHSFKSMQILIDDLLDIARIESGIELQTKPVPMSDVIERTLQMLRPQADDKEQSLQVDVPPSLPQVQGDLHRLEQIFTNLISNAIKYTPPNGQIKIYAETHSDMLRVHVEDNGLGIGAEDLSQIFERFHRVRRPETDSIEGTGLGLAIVKALIEAHEGKIDVSSQLGVGSTFRVTLPLAS